MKELAIEGGKCSGIAYDILSLHNHQLSDTCIFCMQHIFLAHVSLVWKYLEVERQTNWW
jgi:hypothetical protein